MSRRTEAWMRDFDTFSSRRYIFFGADDFARAQTFAKWDAQPYPKWLNGMFFKNAAELDRVMRLKERGASEADADPDYSPNTRGLTAVTFAEEHVETRSVSARFLSEDPEFFVGESAREDIPQEEETEQDEEDIAA
jgi:hypothetical protein